MLIYPWIVHWTWGGGWLSNLGFLDFAGSGIVHLTGGVAGLIGAKMVGSRIGRFNNQDIYNNEEDRDRDFRPHNVPMVVLDNVFLFYGWVGMVLMVVQH